jgi:hypothetical protein
MVKDWLEKYTVAVHYSITNPHEECGHEYYNPAVVDTGG